MGIELSCSIFQAYYFDRDDQALPNFAKFFRKQSHEEREHAEKLMGLQNKRGGRIFLQDIRVRARPVCMTWTPVHIVFVLSVFSMIVGLTVSLCASELHTPYLVSLCPCLPLRAHVMLFFDFAPVCVCLSVRRTE